VYGLRYLIRHIQYEAPGLGVVENEVSAVVCFNEECDETVRVDPATLVVEDDEAVSVEADVYDPETGGTTGRTEVEIYCSKDCRNEQRRQAITDDPPGRL
jgi:hypothetical protein